MRQVLLHTLKIFAGISISVHGNTVGPIPVLKKEPALSPRPFPHNRTENLRNSEILCDKFEARWANGAPFPPGEFLECHADQLNDQIVAELIRIDLDYRFPDGSEYDTETIVRQWPGYADIARQIGESYRWQNEDLRSFEFNESVYEVGELIGAGGMGRVYRGRDRRLSRSVAIKRLHPDLAEDRAAFACFQNEARIVAAIRHDGIVKVFDVGVKEDELFMVFELIEGGSLEETFARQTFTPRQAARMARSVADTLVATHRSGILHLDLKPSNVLVTLDQKLKVSDFGLARLIHSGFRGNRPTGPVGTSGYMSPEQENGDLERTDERTDIFGVGALLYRAITGQAPKQTSGDVQTGDAHRHSNSTRIVAPSKFRSSIPPTLEGICLKCLAENPDERYATAMDLVRDIDRFLEDRPTIARPINSLGRIGLWIKRNRSIAQIGLASVLSIAAITSVLVSRILNERDRFRKQRDIATERLYDSLIDQARSIRLAKRCGFREDAWAKIHRAIELNLPRRDRLVLRDEVVANFGSFWGQTPETWSSEPMSVGSAIHPDRPWLAIGRFDGSIQIRDLEQGNVISIFQASDSAIFDLCFSPDGDRLAIADQMGAIGIWEAVDSTGTQWRRLTSMRGPPTERPNFVKAISLAFNPNGMQLFSCPFGGSRIQAWRISDGQPQPDEFVGAEAISRFSLSPHADRLAIGTASNQVVIWNRKTKRLEGSIDLSDAPAILDLTYSPNGRLLAIGTNNGAFVFDAATLALVLKIPGDRLITLSFSPDSRTLALPSEDLNLVRLWDIPANREIVALQNDAYEAIYSNDSRYLVCVHAHGSACWSLDDMLVRRDLATHPSGVERIVFCDAAETLIATGRQSPSRAYLLGDTRIGTPMYPLNSKVLSASDKFLTCQSGEWLEVVPFELVSESKPIARFKHRLGDHVTCAFLDSEAKFVFASGDRGVHVWELTPHNGRWAASPPKILFNHFAGSLCTSDDSNYVAWADRSGKLHVRELSTGRKMLSSTWPATMPYGLGFAAGTHTLVFASVSANVTVWDVDQDISTAQSLPLSPTSEVGDWQTVRLRLDPTGRRLCIQRGRTIEIWDFAARRRLVTLPQSAALPWSLAWNNQGTRLAIGHANGRIAFWDLEAINKQLQSFGLDWPGR